jgi:hypothetical protein
VDQPLGLDRHILRLVVREAEAAVCTDQCILRFLQMVDGCHSAYNFGSDASLVQRRLFCADQPGLKQIDFAATVHLTASRA